MQRVEPRAGDRLHADPLRHGKTDATAEVERYIAIPGQALAYKIGQLTILKLKAEAQAKQGASFDPRGFHAAVLDSGALPMPVLEDKVRAWMATK